MTEITQQDQPLDWRKEFKVDPITGQVSINREGLARFCGTSKDSLKIIGATQDCLDRDSFDEHVISKTACNRAVSASDYRLASIMFRIFFAGIRGASEDPVIVDATQAMSFCGCVVFCHSEEEKRRRKTRKRALTKEREIQKMLAESRRGSIEVLTKAGRIDVLTADQLIEIKQASDWKSGIGQLLAYGVEYPRHRKVLYLFGSAPNIAVSDMKFVLTALEIQLEIHSHS